MKFRRIGMIAGSLLLLGFLIYQIPSVKLRVDWRLDIAQTYVRSVLHPAGALPAPQVNVVNDAPATAVTSLPPTATPEASPTPLPAAAQLPAPPYEVQTANNCGPATLALYLRFYGWDGSQKDISEVVKPVNGDRNVNPDELLYFASTRAGWLKSMYRVGGTLELVKQLVAAGVPVMVEEGEYLDEDARLNDDRWAGHYILITGYDDALQKFTFQDTWKGANLTRTYAETDTYWHQYNRLYFLVYLPEQEETVKNILGETWDEDTSRQVAMETTQTEIQADSNNPYSWFNLGADQVYFEQYGAAATSFDKARQIGLPMRMLRYQFGPFFAYYFSDRMDDLQAIVNYALEITPNSEEALLWKARLLEARGDCSGALNAVNQAQKANPNSSYVTLAQNDVCAG